MAVAHVAGWLQTTSCSWQYSGNGEGEQSAELLYLHLTLYIGCRHWTQNSQSARHETKQGHNHVPRHPRIGQGEEYQAG